MARYHAYLLRIWCSTADDRYQWRCRIEHLPRGEQQQFTEPQALMAYLLAQGELQGHAPDMSAQAAAPQESVSQLPGTQDREDGQA